MPSPPDVRDDRPEPWRPRPGSVRASAQVAEAQFRGLLEAAPDAIVIADADGRIIIVNRQAEAWFGYQREELLGQPVELLVPERFRSEHVRHRADYRAEPRTRPMGSGLELFFPVLLAFGPAGRLAARGRGRWAGPAPRNRFRA